MRGSAFDLQTNSARLQLCPPRNPITARPAITSPVAVDFAASTQPVKFSLKQVRPHRSEYERGNKNDGIAHA